MRDYMSHYSTSKNNSFDEDYKADLAPNLIDVDSPTNTPGPADIYRQIYFASRDALTAFLLWLATSRLTAEEDYVRIVLLHSIYQFVSHLGGPATKWDSKVFSATVDVVAGTVALSN